jgi:hydroxymethylbilane synthase
MSKEIVIGSRGSDLALWQANFIKDALESHQHKVRIKIIKTQGDRIQHLSFDKMEGKGFFTKELEAALLSSEIDLAVHSYKDLETTQPEGLTIGATSYRANPADLLLVNKDKVDHSRSWGLAKGSTLGTSSARRKMQALKHRPDLTIKDIRGNVPTRIQKLRDGLFDAIVLAKAGVERLKLDLGEFHSYEFDPTEFIPAPAQGVLACQIREDDQRLRQALSPIHNPEVAEQVSVERKILNLFQGGCQLPFGAYCRKTSQGYELRAIVSEDPLGSPVEVSMTAESTTHLASEAFERLKKKIQV